MLVSVKLFGLKNKNVCIQRPLVTMVFYSRLVNNILNHCSKIYSLQSRLKIDYMNSNKYKDENHIL